MHALSKENIIMQSSLTGVQLIIRLFKGKQEINAKLSLFAWFNLDVAISFGVTEPLSWKIFQSNGTGTQNVCAMFFLSTMDCKLKANYTKFQ